jgi:phage terminase large subunit
MAEEGEINFDVSSIYYKNYTAPSDIVINRGGTSSTKTYSLCQLFITFLITEEDKRILISRKYNTTMHLTILADFFSILKDSGIYDKCIHSKYKKTILYPPTGSIINYTGLDEAQKLKGTNFNYIWLNEADEFSYEQFIQLYLRLRRKSKDNKPNKIFLDFNPSDTYSWIRTKLEDNNKGTLIHSTYKDNPFLDPATVAKIQDLELNDPDFFKIYGLGEYTSIKGLIYSNFEIVKELPEVKNCTWLAYGLDFGFSIDPCALIECRYAKGEIWLKEIVYTTGLINSDLAAKMEEAKIDRRAEVYADSAEPKSIEELFRAGFNTKPAKKGRDSIAWGIQLVRGYKLNILHSSKNLIKEVRSYKWAEDKNGDSLNKPIDKHNHALDALRYCLTMKLSRRGGLSILKSS